MIPTNYSFINNNAERNKWLIEKAQKLLIGRQVIIIDIYGDPKDIRTVEANGPDVIFKVNAFGSPADGIISVYSKDGGFYCQNTISHFSQKDYTLHTISDAMYNLYRIFKVIVPTQKEPQGTTKKQ